jgi:2',3'-cyclic-nucleotide 2'-phosphodiesterase (5'-nucleotidase family)
LAERRLTSGLALAILLLAACSGGPRADAPVRGPGQSGFTILQINDTYKIEGLRAGTEGGMGRVRALRNRLEAEGRPVVVLHAGDFLFPSVMSKYLKGEAMVDVLNLLDGGDGFDPRFFVTFGNHEFDDQDRQVLFDRIEQSEFTWIGTNVRVKGEGDFAPLGERFETVKDHVVVEIGGIRLGIFSLTLDDQKQDWLQYDYAPEVRRAVVERSLDALESGGAEFVVALTHQNLEQDEALASEFGSRIDWIVGGHEHVYLRRDVGGTTITKADADAKSALRIDVGREQGKTVATASRIELDASAPVDPGVTGRVATWLVRLESVFREQTGLKLLDVVATTEHALEGIEPAIRGRETALGDFLCDVLRQRLETEVALINGGAVRVNDDVPAGGDLRIYELEGIFYYDARPVVFEVTGRQLLDLLRVSVSKADLGHGRFLQVSGVRFRYHAAPGVPPRVDAAEIEVWRDAEKRFGPLDLDRRYRTASLDYLWRNGYRDGYPLFSLGAGGTSPEPISQPELSWRRITEEAIAALPGRRITTGLDGRIQRVGDRQPARTPGAGAARGRDRAATRSGGSRTSGRRRSPG